MRVIGGLFLGLAELVPEKIEDEKSQGQEKCGKEDAPPRGLDRIEEGGSIGQKGSPAGKGSLDSEAQEAEKRFFQDDCRQCKGEVGQNGREYLG